MGDIDTDSILNRHDLSIIISRMGVSRVATDSLTELVMVAYERGRRDVLREDDRLVKENKRLKLENEKLRADLEWMQFHR